MSSPLVTINLVVLNGEKYIRHCLDGILAQTYPHELIEVNILDNGSADKTKEIINATRSDLEARTDLKDFGFAKFNLVELTKNIGVWPGQEKLLQYSIGKYVLGLCVDVIVDKDFVKNAIEVMEKDEKIGALQAKIYKYDIRDLEIGNWKLEIGGTIDTCGFHIFKSRRVINIGHGEEDKGPFDSAQDKQFNEQKDIFGVEGAAPFFRKSALEDCRLSTNYAIAQNVENSKSKFSREILDHDFFWYGDDLDLVWRMNMFGWRQVFAPSVIAWHDRQTTKTLRKSQADFIKIRRQIPARKRRLDWRNTRFTIIKNDYIINILKDLPYILKREFMMFGYLVVFEPSVLFEIPEFLRLIPKMLKKRREVMGRAKTSAKEIHKWFK
ncbi:MAG: hypothetical protein A3B91_04455 [Candidatus Yanofskybacteria bacterium RIFCSPHIGHO2_02_FULL_41_29]|uniref:Glycosyltransferase 2-like domain-containing protein n=1 Tax=Candidatus Yanofskybacteria bacterium RIFCSPHIGHO2_01_FULL_41_53 TaxID=1802663 RepID=A0A1F8EI16_9BACT|nr:MAG: hypothetical protein A2650_03715 [Candidatus Yanofskybacteria bacterium RIFCSPHIGHO2_01_FULL_41_53]OGN11771.1 MAG: hypothetical protein A3B91_04455 [Candidatus Yanofskybacteria bacterium RIFCSPHIGHO2_02_FULL_41_29]OGN22925.1 MAG: hypothetical protein A2916_00910 [Candidatus Yanofskybacteria bacterium RIFCSPLOWO2_01_FULL_41_67]OGN30202.1 MAG: hypothetical protein A3H54_00965 [Candidatus Yanofskybacteria bacterium RIFCSPLOWO2_02_FULL_41_13]